MKRLIVLVFCFLVLFAGVAAAWESCKQISLAAHDHSAVHISAHDDHPNSNHENSDHAAIHCPTFEKFVPTAIFSTKPDERIERLTGSVGVITSQIFDYRLHRLVHGPPGAENLSTIPSYLLLSVLRI
jgi:hypothetical protein